MTARQYDVNFWIKFESLFQQSNIMAELVILANGKCDLKFHAAPKNFKRIEKFKHKSLFFKIYVDKNDSVYDIKLCTVLSWKTIEKGKKKFNVPDEVQEVREVRIFDKVKGNPFKIATTKIVAELDLLSRSDIQGSL